MRFSRRIGKAEPQRIIVIGAGEVGFRIAQRLSMENQLVVVVDLNNAKLAQLADKRHQLFNADINQHRIRRGLFYLRKQRRKIRIPMPHCTIKYDFHRQLR